MFLFSFRFYGWIKCTSAINSQKWEFNQIPMCLSRSSHDIARGTTGACKWGLARDSTQGSEQSLEKGLIQTARSSARSSSLCEACYQHCQKMPRSCRWSNSYHLSTTQGQRWQDSNGFLLRGCVALQKRRAERCRHPCGPKAAGEKVEVISVPYTATFLLEHGLCALSRAPGNH